MISCSQAAFKAANDEPTTTTIPKVKAPTFSVESGTKFKSSILVDINCSTRDAVIRYSYDNVNWVIGTILLISETKTVYAKATKDGMIDSDVVSAIYICTNAATSTTTSSIQDVSTTLPSTTTSTSVKTSTTIDAYASTTTTTTIPKVKAPTFSVESGTKFKSPVLVDINCSTRDAVIRYSYDNVNWVIGTILLISETKTVYAKATKDGMIDSDVVSAIYICTAVSTTSTSTSTTIAPTTTTSTTTTTTIAPTTSTSVASMTTSTSTTIAPLYEVTFNSDGGSFVNSQTINYGGKVTQPIDPTKTNYIFSGWYKESTLINLWNFDSDTITTDTILYAGWMLDSNPALWAKSVTAGNNTSLFNSVAVDSSGNVYAAGHQYGTGSYAYGEGVSVAGSGSSNVVLVKYNSSGNALWAKSVTAGNNTSLFNSVAVDSSGNVYAAGYQSGTGSFTYGEGVSVAGSSSYYNVVLVKYDSSGTALWAKSVTAGTSSSCFNSVAVDSSGNVYAAGYQNGTGSYTYGEGVSVVGSYSYSVNVVLVKYNSSGTALWAKSVTAGTNWSKFNSVAVDSSGNVYAAGHQDGTGSFTYGAGVSVAGSGSSNVVLVKYDSSGTALWAKSVTAGTKLSEFNSVAVDSSGNVYAAGYQSGTGSYTYGPGVSVAGSYAGPDYYEGNVVLVKYNSSGAALWAKSVTSGNSNSHFYSVAVDSSGNVYAAGYQNGTGSYAYGPGVSVAGTYTRENVVLVKYGATP